MGRILDALGAEAGSGVVEVGPGEGALTRPLLQRGVRVVAFELDPRLAERLGRQLAGQPVAIHREDALRADVGAALKEAGLAPPVPLVGNLPYESATPMVRAFVRRPDLFARAVVMVQREVAERLAAGPGDEAYGFLSVDVAAHAGARLLFEVSRHDFDPPPRVVSAVVELTPRAAEPRDVAALEVAAAGFATRRKTLLNALSARWPRAAVRDALASCGVAETARAEELALPAFASLAARLGPPTGPARHAPEKPAP